MVANAHCAAITHLDYLSIGEAARNTDGRKEKDRHVPPVSVLISPGRPDKLGIHILYSREI